MSILLGTLIQKGAQIGALSKEKSISPYNQQQLVLRWLLRKAQDSAFGRYYGFRHLAHTHNLPQRYAAQIPAMDYNRIYERWWAQAHLCDTPDVCWPGLTPYYALSSGTSQAATKYIPVTEDMLRFMKRGARQMFFDLTKFGIPAKQYTRQMLMVGSCTVPKQEGRHFTGDLSGILGLNRPLWMERFYRPGKDITNLSDWGERIERIAQEAPKWDIGFAVSNPMWLQLILERIIAQYGVRHIHEIWPNFALYVHGGVFFEPYRTSFEQLLGKPVSYLNSYMASEGLFAWAQRPHCSDMQLTTDSGIFFEFVPFNAENFDDNGDLCSEHPISIALNEVDTRTEYALLISTCAGAWRYLLGDTVRFTDVEKAGIKLTGRTKQHISVCGEHLSVDNLNEAIRRADAQLQAGIREFCVSGVRLGSQWGHQWYLSCDNTQVRPEQLEQALDAALCALNEDYAVERIYALKSVRVRVLPNRIFLEWLASKGKLNGQAKVPRVMKGAQLEDFERFLKNTVDIGSI